MSEEVKEIPGQIPKISYGIEKNQYMLLDIDSIKPFNRSFKEDFNILLFYQDNALQLEIVSSFNERAVFSLAPEFTLHELAIIAQKETISIIDLKNLLEEGETFDKDSFSGLLLATTKPDIYFKQYTDHVVLEVTLKKESGIFYQKLFLDEKTLDKYLDEPNDDDSPKFEE